ncbi:hypothetical protein HG536_0A07750 [Torulaspora globosa]|uniref:Serine/threonine-protein phosphatase 2A activator n=1 Tax=Torulaspora globosa TaxID=48254 RepID=A0A7G3ZBS4_9SACH|nr:uncharacterized protein HG536_0A07750 [Torulaspora globosa]QLL30960.1 hypothetical protein HG536_0A07750 [Torulaspora globosa]
MKEGIPEKRLLTNDDMQLWGASHTKKELLGFITGIAEAVKGLDNSQYNKPVTTNVSSLELLLQDIGELVSKHPVKERSTKSRFGKVEFRDFYDDVAQHCKGLIKNRFTFLNEEQVSQLSVYLTECWGDRTRIDYGSGHELNFLCVLYGLHKYGAFNLDTDAANLVLVAFVKYLDIMRMVETIYWLEPAGSHGVWGLDDYHFLPFLFGAFQLSTHRHLRPKSIHNKEVVEMFESKYLYFGCISFINSVKTTASLRWHSPMLDDISGVKTWSKVAEGMIKMYDAEVLSKRPIMQHFYFCEFLPCPEGVSPARYHNHGDDAGCCGHEYEQNTWGDCCGIKVPSAIAATRMEKRHDKPIPFD